MKTMTAKEAREHPQYQALDRVVRTVVTSIGSEETQPICNILWLKAAIVGSLALSDKMPGEWSPEECEKLIDRLVIIINEFISGAEVPPSPLQEFRQWVEQLNNSPGATVHTSQVVRYATLALDEYEKEAVHS